jgi:hypothetical protein
VRIDLETPRATETKETDTHWRSQKGVGNFNYRMVFPIKFDPAEPQNTRLKVSAWDRDIISANDSIGEVVLPMKSFLISSYNKWRRKSQGAKVVVAADDKSKTDGPGNEGEAEADKEEEDSFYFWGPKFDLKNSQHTVPNKWLSLGPEKGEILMTIELLHDMHAGAKEVAEGRDSPNQHPFLHEPKRPKFNIFDPIGMLALLVGPDIWNRFKCIIICIYSIFCLWIAFILLSYVRIWLPDPS